MNYQDYVNQRKVKIRILKRYDELSLEYSFHSNKGSYLDSNEYHMAFEDSIKDGLLERGSRYKTVMEDIDFTLENKDRLDLNKGINNFLFNINKGLPELNLELYLYLINLGYTDMESYIRGKYYLFYLRPFPTENSEELMQWAKSHLERRHEQDIAIVNRQMYREQVFIYSEFEPSSYFELISELETIPQFQPGVLEIELFNNCIQIIRDNPNASKIEIPKLLSKATTGMTVNYAKLFLVYLGLLGILLPKDKTPIFLPNSIYEFKGLPMNAGKFYCYPYSLWQPKDGVNEKYLEYWFGDICGV